MRRNLLSPQRRRSRPAPEIQATASKTRDHTSFITKGCSLPAKVTTTLPCGRPLRCMPYTSRRPVLYLVGKGVIMVRFPQSRSGIGRMMYRRPRSGACEAFLLLAHIAALCFRNSSIGCGETGETDDDDNWAPRDSRRGNGESCCDNRGCAM